MHVLFVCLLTSSPRPNSAHSRYRERERVTPRACVCVCERAKEREAELCGVGSNLKAPCALFSTSGPWVSGSRLARGNAGRVGGRRTW